jgi:hypothetical protein
MKADLQDIVDIKPVNMEELTEVITAAEFHPIHCNMFMYSSSKGTIKLADMRESALCDQHAKREYACHSAADFDSVRGRRRSRPEILLLRNHLVDIRCEIQQRWTLHSLARLFDSQNLGHRHGEQAGEDH